jgi:hypothetical protein
MSQATVPATLLDELDRLEMLRDPDKSITTQRQFTRFVVRGDAELHPMTRSCLDNTPVEVKLRDVGRGGFGFITEKPLPAGSSWRCCFLDHGYVVGEQACVVRHCRQIGPRLYLAGAQIVIPAGILLGLGVDAASLDRDAAKFDGHGGDEAPSRGFLDPDVVD